MLKTKEHYDIMEQFERDFHKSLRLAREKKSLWEIGQIYENGETNKLFKAYRMGYIYGKVSHA